VLFRYTLRGGAPEHWHPRFTYHSFRYVQVSVEPASPHGSMPQVLSLSGDFVHAQSPVVGEFSSSNDLFNRIHVLIDRAVLSNLASVMTDCPSREKLGWLEQTYLNGGTLMWNYDVTGLYEKMASDIADAQLTDGPDAGLVPSIAPEYVAFLDGVGRTRGSATRPNGAAPSSSVNGLSINIPATCARSPHTTATCSATKPTSPAAPKHWPIPYADLRLPSIALWELEAARKLLHKDGTSGRSQDAVFAAILQQRRLVNEAAKHSQQRRRQERTPPEPKASPAFAAPPKVPHLTN
jgi:hypothetical protein